MIIFALSFHPRLEPGTLASHTLPFYPIWSQLQGSSSAAWFCHLYSLSLLPYRPQFAGGWLIWMALAVFAKGSVLKPGLRWKRDKWEFWPLLRTWESMALSGSCYIDGAGQEYGLFQSTLLSCGYRTPKQRWGMARDSIFLTLHPILYSFLSFIWLLFLFSIWCKSSPHARHQMEIIQIHISAIYLLLACLRLEVPFGLLIPWVLLNL